MTEQDANRYLNFLGCVALLAVVIIACVSFPPLGVALALFWLLYRLL